MSWVNNSTRQAPVLIPSYWSNSQPMPVPRAKQYIIRHNWRSRTWSRLCFHEILEDLEAFKSQVSSQPIQNIPGWWLQVRWEGSSDLPAPLEGIWKSSRAKNAQCCPIRMVRIPNCPLLRGNTIDIIPNCQLDHVLLSDYSSYSLSPVISYFLHWNLTSGP